MLCSLCGHNNPSDNRFCGMCGMPLENAVFKPKPGAVPPENVDDPEVDPADDFDDAAAEELTSSVPPLWDRVPPPPSASVEPVVAPAVKREVRSEHAVAVHPGATSVAAPRDDTRERFSTMVQSRARQAESPRSSTSIFGLEDAPAASAEPEREYVPSSISGPSFLGLDSGAPGNGDYLLDDEESGHGRAWLVVIVVLILAALIGLQWRTEVQNQAQRVASAVKARLQQPNAKPAATANESGTSTDAKNGEDSSAAPSAAPQTEAAKTIGGDQNPFKGAGPEQTAGAPAEKSNAPAEQSAASSEKNAPAADKITAANKPEETSRGAEPAKAEKPAVTKEIPAEKIPSEKQAPAAEEQRSSAADKHASRFSPTSATREPAREPAVDDSMLMMAQKYLQGQGVPRSCDQGMVYLRQAVRQPSPRARSQMGALYATGTCVPQNRVEAYRWFTSALDLDPRNPWLARERDILYSEMTPTERQRVSP